jgi:hypothetical protein
MILPVTSLQWFYSCLCFFIVIGFVRGWCREIVSLVFVLLAVCLIHPDTSDSLNCFLGRSGYAITYLGGVSQHLPPTCSSVFGFLSGSFWSLLLFLLLIALGYLIGNRVFPCPRCVLDRCFGIVPAIISGSFIIFYMCSFFRATGQPAELLISLQQTNPALFVPIMCVIVIIAIIIALIAACFR